MKSDSSYVLGLLVSLDSSYYAGVAWILTLRCRCVMPAGSSCSSRLHRRCLQTLKWPARFESVISIFSMLLECMPIYPMEDCVQVTLSTAFQDVYVHTAWKLMHTVRAAGSWSKCFRWTGSKIILAHYSQTAMKSFENMRFKYWTADSWPVRSTASHPRELYVHRIRLPDTLAQRSWRLPSNRPLFMYSTTELWC
jgi:hypothetical protein